MYYEYHKVKKNQGGLMTAKSEDHDKILGLEVGADDYIVKPFSHEEMLARIRAIMRRVDIKDIKKEQLD